VRRHAAGTGALYSGVCAAGPSDRDLVRQGGQHRHADGGGKPACMDRLLGALSAACGRSRGSLSGQFRAGALRGASRCCHRRQQPVGRLSPCTRPQAGRAQAAGGQTPPAGTHGSEAGSVCSRWTAVPGAGAARHPHRPGDAAEGRRPARRDRPCHYQFRGLSTAMVPRKRNS
jgi:hypothetical protein